MSSGNADEALPSIIPQLLSRDFGGYLDTLLRQIVVDNRTNIHTIIDSIIHAEQRRTGKGSVSGRKATATSTTAPAYTLRDPKISPTVASLKANSFYATTPTRSYLEPLAERQDSVRNVLDLYNVAIEECRTAVSAIVKGCQAKGPNTKFFDHTFYFDKRSTMYPEGSPADCTVGEPKFTQRLTELYGPNCKLYVNGVTADDIMQGGVGDCFLIGAISAIAANDSNSIQELFAAHDVACGVYGVVFYKDGAWEWVVVDDFIPVNKGRSGKNYPLFAAPSEPTEVWPCILEKAFAKMHYNWDTIDGGWAREAIVDLTGGGDYAIDLYRDDKNMTFKSFCSLVQNPLSIVSCAVGDHVADSDAVGSAGEAGAVFGLFKGHQYGVLDAKECSDGTGFVRVRNPWGQCEWTGPYSDGSKEWKQNPLHKKEINPTFGDDGDFWMCWDDFKKYMTQVDVVMIFPDSAQVLTVYGVSNDSNPSADKTFILQVLSTSSDVKGAPAKFSIVVAQEDPKTKYDSTQHAQQKFTPYGSMRIVLNKLRSVPLPTDAEDIGSLRSKKILDVGGRERSQLLEVELEPGMYSLTVTIQTEGNSATPIGFYSRVVGMNAAQCDQAKISYAYWRLSAPQKRLCVGRYPAEALTVEESVSGRLSSKGNTTATVASEAVKQPMPQSLSQLQSAPQATISTPIRPTTTPTPTRTPLSAKPGVDTSQMSRDELKAALDNEILYRCHIEELYRRENSQAQAAINELTRLRAQFATQETEMEKLRKQSNINFRDPMVTPSKSPAPSVASRQSWERVGISRSEWSALVTGTFSIAASRNSPPNSNSNAGSITSQDAVQAIRSLVTAGLGIDDLLHQHPLLSSGTVRISLADFSTLADDIVSSWGFAKCV